MYVWACYSDTPLGSNVWWPVNTPLGKTNDGQDLTADEIGKITTLWFNTIGGLLIVLGERAETRGTWSEWKKGLLESLPTLDVRQLSRRQVDSLLELFEDFKDYRWPLFRDQLANPPAERSTLDEKFYEITCGSKPNSLNEIYSRLGKDVSRLVSIMKKSKPSQTRDLTSFLSS
jgi:hypothetical protein